MQPKMGPPIDIREPGDLPAQDEETGRGVPVSGKPWHRAWPLSPSNPRSSQDGTDFDD